MKTRLRMLLPLMAALAAMLIAAGCENKDRIKYTATVLNVYELSMDVMIDDGQGGQYLGTLVYPENDGNAGGYVKGQRVEIIANSTVPESYPVMIDAVKLKILK